MKGKLLIAILPLVFLGLVFYLNLDVLKEFKINDRSSYGLLSATILIVGLAAYSVYNILSDSKSKSLKIFTEIFAIVVSTAILYFSYGTKAFERTFLFILLIPFAFYDLYKTLKR